MSGRAPAPDTDATLLLAVINGLGSAPALDDAASDPVNALPEVAEVADLVAALDEDERRALLAGDWSVPGLLAVLEALDPTSRDEIVGLLAKDNTPRLHTLTAAMLRRNVEGAATVDDVLTPDSTASILLAAAQSAGPGGAYAPAVAAAAPDVIEGLRRVPVPAAISRLLAVLHGAATRRFGMDMATGLLRGVLSARVLGPALTPAAEVELSARVERADPALDALVEEIVEAGLLAEDAVVAGEDPDSLVVQRGAALSGDEAPHNAFADPTPDDPLGTCPAVSVSALGQAIAQARLQRPRDYSWAAVQALRNGDPDGFTLLLFQERCSVLDLPPCRPS